MMKLKLVALLTAIILNSCVLARAEVVLRPPDLNPGDPYRLVFVTSGVTRGWWSDIEFYNAFVQEAADSSPLGALGQTWKAIGSTDSVNARENTSTDVAADGPGPPIYLVDGTLFANDYADLWDGSVATSLNVTENGDERPLTPGHVGSIVTLDALSHKRGEHEPLPTG